MKVTVGIDVVDVERFRKALSRWNDRLKQRLFTEEELRYCEGKHDPALHMAARFAAKVSLFKALGRFFSYKDVTVTRDDSGMPGFNVTGDMGGDTISLSITHDGGLAFAQTLVCRD